jgi:hypothetical protein
MSSPDLIHCCPVNIKNVIPEFAKQISGIHAPFRERSELFSELDPRLRGDDNWGLYRALGNDPMLFEIYISILIKALTFFMYLLYSFLFLS